MKMSLDTVGGRFVPLLTGMTVNILFSLKHECNYRNVFRPLGKSPDTDNIFAIFKMFKEHVSVLNADAVLLHREIIQLLSCYNH